MDHAAPAAVAGYFGRHCCLPGSLHTYVAAEFIAWGRGGGVVVVCFISPRRDGELAVGFIDSEEVGFGLDKGRPYLISARAVRLSVGVVDSEESRSVKTELVTAVAESRNSPLLFFFSEVRFLQMFLRWFRCGRRS